MRSDGSVLKRIRKRSFCCNASCFLDRGRDSGSPGALREKRDEFREKRREKPGKNPGKGSRNKPVRIDRPHYDDWDDYECSVCGARFRKKSMTCPRCGARFEGTKTDEEAFTEEFVLWDDDDD